MPATVNPSNTYRIIMKKISCLFFFFTCLGFAAVSGQNFVSMTYQYNTVTLPYGSSVDFGGNAETHLMDISYPTNDVPPPGGRPLMLLIHGGVFMAGTKADGDIVRMRQDFAKRGYVTASIDYRLGMFQTISEWHCNLTGLFGTNIEWDCMNQSDTTEWVRAWYRGVQDAHGAIRFLVNNAATYNINPNKVFVVGQSAGAFIALGVGFMDHVSETPYGVGTLPNVQRPNAIYDYGCVRKYGWDSNLASLDLTRPNLGSYLGTMNQPSASYRIVGVGDFYGAMFKNLFAVNASSTQIPCLYMYHRSNDLLVPSGRDRVLANYSYCASSGFGCSPILNRPMVSGAFHMKTLIDQRAAQGLPRPQYLADLVNSNVWCDVNSHQIDNYALRTGNMASFFAPRVLGTAKMGDFTSSSQGSEVQIFPNPSKGAFRLVLPEGMELQSVSLADLAGREVYRTPASGLDFTANVPSEIARGVYLMRLHTVQGDVVRRVVLE